MMTNIPIDSITLKEVQSKQRLLVAFAHPDDETFGPGGTLIHYAKRNVAIHYVCGTRGEAGLVEPKLLEGYDSIGELRTQELRCAAEILGLASLHFLNYHDSGMENSPDNENPNCLIQASLEVVAEKITRLIRQIKPQVVLTFDPHGGYFHPDHIYMHQAATMAFHAASDPAKFPQQIEAGLDPYRPQKLYYTTFRRGLVKAIVKLLPLFGQDPTAFGRNKDINLTRIVETETRVTTRIKVSPYFATNQRAAVCHASQITGGPSQITPFLRKWFGRYDTYTRIVPPFTNNAPFEKDLFAGIPK